MSRYYIITICIKKIKDFDKGDKMVFLKKSLGADVNMLMSKQDCRGIIKYYDSL